MVRPEVGATRCAHARAQLALADLERLAVERSRRRAGAARARASRTASRRGGSPRADPDRDRLARSAREPCAAARSAGATCRCPGGAGDQHRARDRLVAHSSGQPASSVTRARGRARRTASACRAACALTLDACRARRAGTSPAASPPTSKRASSRPAVTSSSRTCASPACDRERATRRAARSIASPTGHAARQHAAPGRERHRRRRGGGLAQRERAARGVGADLVGRAAPRSTSVTSERAVEQPLEPGRRAPGRPRGDVADRVGVRASPADQVLASGPGDSSVTGRSATARLASSHRRRRPARPTAGAARSRSATADAVGSPPAARSRPRCVPSAASALATAPSVAGRRSGLLREQPRDQIVERGGQRRGGARATRGASSRRIFASTAMHVARRERRPPGQALEQHAAEREHVGARVELPLAARLLGRHVAGRADHRAGPRHGGVGRAPVSRATPKSSTFDAARLSPSTRNRFDGLMSRCTMPRACAAPSAAAIRARALHRLGRRERPLRASRSPRSRPRATPSRGSFAALAVIPCAT